jgi:hypothetical protein
MEVPPPNVNTILIPQGVKLPRTGPTYLPGQKPSGSNVPLPDGTKIHGIGVGVAATKPPDMDAYIVTTSQESEAAMASHVASEKTAAAASAAAVPMSPS